MRTIKNLMAFFMGFLALSSFAQMEEWPEINPPWYNGDIQDGDVALGAESATVYVKLPEKPPEEDQPPATGSVAAVLVWGPSSGTWTSDRDGQEGWTHSAGVVNFSLTEPGIYNVTVTYKAPWQKIKRGHIIPMETFDSETFEIVVYRITTQTESTAESLERNRKTLGVGEKVTLSFEPSGIDPDWALENEDSGSISGTTFTAGDTAGSAKVICTDDYGLDDFVQFTVKTPTEIHLDPPFARYHINSFPSDGLKCNAYIKPNDVSFYRIKIIVAESTWSASGCLSIYDNTNMIEQEVGVLDPVDEKGSQTAANMKLSFLSSILEQTGNMSCSREFFYKVTTEETRHSFVTNQTTTGEVESDGTAKSGLINRTSSSELSDPTVGGSGF